MLLIPKLSFRRKFEAGPPGMPDVPPIRVALIGDSLSTGFHVSSPAAMLLRTRTCNGNWFVDDSGNIGSVLERLSARVPVVLHHLAYVSAHIDLVCQRTLMDRIAGTFHMSHQIDRVLALKPFPEIVLLWIGHNNLDWANSCGDAKPDETRLPRLADDAVAGYAKQFERLLEAARQQPHPVRFVIFALVSFEYFFEARAQTEAIKQREPSRYPFLEIDYRYFISMRPEYRKGMIELANLINSRLEVLVARMRSRHSVESNSTVSFSMGLHDARINKAECLCDVDGWHPSPLGHQTLAEGAFPVVYQEIAKQRSFDKVCPATASPS